MFRVFVVVVVVVLSSKNKEKCYLFHAIQNWKPCMHLFKFLLLYIFLHQSYSNIITDYIINKYRNIYKR